MKKLYIFTTLLLAFVCAVSCSKMQVGYARTDVAGYQPDTVCIKEILDPVKDAERIKQQRPYMSDPIQRVQGTRPFTYKIIAIHSSQHQLQPDVLDYFQVRNNGVIEIAYNHKLKPGFYVLDMRISNVYESVIKESIITIHVLSAEEWDLLYGN